MKALVAGYGSIGKRHARLLGDLGCEVAVVSGQEEVGGYPVYSELEAAVREFAPDYVVIATITARHGENLNALKQAGFTGTALVEKPLFAQGGEAQSAYPFSVFVGYQLRFHPVIAALRERLQNYTPLTAHVYVGQHLSQWRPGRTLEETYSGSRAQGGGVMRDLSHELDLAQYLFGPIHQSQALVGRVGQVTVDSEDVAAFLLSCPRCPVISMQMNYLDPIPRREWVVVCEGASFKADLIAGTLSANQDIHPIPFQPDDPYRAMHRALLSGQAGEACGYEEGLAVVEMIDKVLALM